jgi:ribose transport system substrate-binding protein
MSKIGLMAFAFVLGVSAAVSASGAKADNSQSGQPASATMDVPETSHYKFAWIMPDMFNPFWVYMRQGAEKAALEYMKQGVKVDVQQMAPIQTFNVEEQVGLFENAIQMKVDGVGICVIDQTAVVQPVNKAMAAGIPTIALSTDIPNSQRLAFSGVDDRKWAASIAEYAIKHNNGTGGYIALEGIPGNLISELRLAGFKDAIAKYPGTKLLDVQPSNFNRKDGQAAMENLLTKYPKGQIQGVFTVNDEAALGAIEAIDAAGRTDEISVVGIDGNKDAAQAILDGRILATVSDDPWAKGYQAVKALVEYKTGQKIPEVLPIQARIIDKSNAADLLKHFPEMDAYYKP